MKRWMAHILVTAFLLCGCASGQVSTPVQLGSKPTVDDIFTAPVTTAPTVANATEPMGTTEPIKPSQSIPMGGIGFGPSGDHLMDEYGHYFPYDGGEMCMTFRLQASGQTKISCAQDGVGVLFFLGGQPQPYRFGEDGELCYFHILYPQFDVSSGEDEEIYFDLYFTPVSGAQGEMVEFFVNPILCPEWTTADSQAGFKYTFGSCYSGSRLKMNVAAPKAEKPEVMERVKTVDITYKDVSPLEIAGWSDRDLIMKNSFRFRVDGRGVKTNNYIYDFSASDSVELRFEIWGTPYVKYGVMFYIDNQPISAQQKILFDMKNGQKTVITVTVDMSDFDGECAIYAALIPLNCRSTEIITTAFLSFSKTYILLDDPEPET